MPLYTCLCPTCGQKAHYRRSSLGTVRRCSACGSRFVLQAPWQETPTGRLLAPLLGCLLLTLLLSICVLGGLVGLIVLGRAVAQ